VLTQIHDEEATARIVDNLTGIVDVDNEVEVALVIAVQVLFVMWVAVVAAVGVKVVSSSNPAPPPRCDVTDSAVVVQPPSFDVIGLG
jgi:hypothetical protein